MTLAIESMTRTKSISHQHGCASDRSDAPVDREGHLVCLDERRPCQRFNADRVGSLLEDPAIALWASEAAAKYEVSTTDALALLAYALFLDGER
jgi:hypothetical protein